MAVPTAFAKTALSAGGLCRQSLSGPVNCATPKATVRFPAQRSPVSQGANLLQRVCQDCYSGAVRLEDLPQWRMRA